MMSEHFHVSLYNTTRNGVPDHGKEYVGTLKI